MTRILVLLLSLFTFIFSSSLVLASSAIEFTDIVWQEEEPGPDDEPMPECDPEDDPDCLPPEEPE